VNARPALRPGGEQINRLFYFVDAEDQLTHRVAGAEPLEQGPRRIDNCLMRCNLSRR
jgi:hypothetical protein